MDIEAFVDRLGRSVLVTWKMVGRLLLIVWTDFSRRAK